MRRLAVLLAAAVLLAGCGAEAAPPTGPSPAQSAAAGAPSAADTAAAVLDGFVCYGADTAGCSLKSAQAAAVLVEYLSRADISAETVTDWQGGLDAQQQELLVLNWDGILYNARQICEDPADGSGLLEAAGVTTDFLYHRPERSAPKAGRAGRGAAAFRIAEKRFAGLGV